MEQVFIKLFNMGMTASWIILVSILLRSVMKRASKNIRCILWALVAVRLICPVSFESGLSLIPSTETINSGIVNSVVQVTGNNIPVSGQTEGKAAGRDFMPEAEPEGNNHLNVLLHMATTIWIFGMSVLMMYAVISYWNLHKKIAESVVLKDNIWLCDYTATPFVWGIIKPRIILPSSIQEQYYEFIIAHEKVHLSRRDHWWKPIGFLLLTVYWFNPFVWAAYLLFCKDIELACDERVIRGFDMPGRKVYSEILLACSVNQNVVAINPVAFGETGIKERIKAIMKYKKPKLWVGFASVIICAAVMICCLANPKAAENKTADIDNTVQNHTSQEDGPSKVSIPESGQIYGYIMKVDTESIIVDRQYWVTSESEDWKPEYSEDAGFAVVDAKEENITYKLSENCTYSILKHHQEPRVELDFQKFKKKYKKMEFPVLWLITLKNNKVIDISEQYIP